MPTQTDNRIRLKDGRTLAYATYGDPQGKPVLHFHGTPSSRMEGNLPLVDESATRLGIRLIVPDRPGMGLSDSRPGRTLLDWPDDVLELADALGLGRFAVVGLSGGGPYVAACAYQIPQRLTAAGIISGVSPLDVPHALQGMDRSDRQMFGLAGRAPWLLRLVFWYTARELRRNPDRALAQMAVELSAPDQAVLAESDIKGAFVQTSLEAFRQGARGATWDCVLFARPWGFRPQDIRVPVYLWHGEVDTTCPISMGRYMAGAIPGCRAHFLPQEGHYSLIARHYEELLRALVG
jgi:pimeloyl-ACP methyl ester carboxylesterase